MGKLAQENGILYYFSGTDCKFCLNFKKFVWKNQDRMRVWASDSYKHKIQDDDEKRGKH